MKDLNIKVTLISQDVFIRDNIVYKLQVHEYYNKPKGDCHYIATSIIDDRLAEKQFSSNTDAQAYLSHFKF